MPVINYQSAIFVRNFTKGNVRKFTINFFYCGHVDVIKYQKVAKFSIESAQTTKNIRPWHRDARELKTQVKGATREKRNDPSWMENENHRFTHEKLINELN